MDSHRSRPSVKEPSGWDDNIGSSTPGLDDSAVQLARPLFHPAPRSAMVLPLVVLVAILPGLAALNTWDLTPPGPLWGLRGLAVLDGLVLDQTPAALEIRPAAEAAAFEAVAYQPPLYAWLVALSFWWSADRNPLASVVPSYLFGTVAILLVYLHGRQWQGAGLGVIAAILVGFNQNLLLRMQEGAPTTLALCGILTVLLSYGWSEQVGTGSMRPWAWAGPVLWTVLSGLALGITLLALGGLALLVIPIVLLHQYYLQAGWTSGLPRLSRPWWRLSWQGRRGFGAGFLTLAVALAVFLPWFIFMIRSHGWQAIRVLEVPPEGLLADHRLSLLPRLIELAPAILPLALYGAVRTIRSALADETNSRRTVGGSLWVIWLAVTALTPAIWRNAPQGELELILLVPLCLLAAQTIADLVDRRIPVRSLVWLVPATTGTVAWWASQGLHEAVDDLAHGRADAGTALGIHLIADLIGVSVWLLHALYRWARRRDDHQRLILAAFLSVAIAVTIGEGLREVWFRHDVTHALLSLRTMILRRNRDSHFQIVAVVSPKSALPLSSGMNRPTDRSLPGGRLRFILKTALPDVPQRDLSSLEEVSKLPEGQRLVILAGADQHLSSADQLKLGLEAIHPGRTGILDAYATAQRSILRR